MEDLLLTKKNNMGFEPLWVRFTPPFLLVCIWGIVTHSVWLFGETYYLRDFWVNYVPARELFREHLLNGTLFLWNPWIGGGLPTLPDPNNGILYFPSWPFILFFKDQGWALSLCVDFHLLFASFGVYLLGKRIASRWGAFAAASVFLMSGLMLSNRINVQFHFAYSWLPLFFWVLNRFLDDIERGIQSLRWTLLLAVVWGFQLLASDPQIVYLEGLGTVLLVISRMVDSSFSLKKVFKALVLICFSALISIMLSSLQLWALFEGLGQTDRAILSEDIASSWSFHWVRLWELILPLPWGEITPETTFWGKSLISGDWNNFYFFSTYLGCFILPLGIMGFKWNSKREIVIGIGITILFLASLGSLTFIHGFFQNIFPFWNVFRYPERLLVIPTLGAVLLMARGVDRIRKSHTRISLILILPGIISAFILFFPGVMGPGAESQIAQETIYRSVSHSLIFPILAVSVIFLLKGIRRDFGFILLICFDLLMISPKLQATWDPPDKGKPLRVEGRTLFLMNDIKNATYHLPPQPEIRRAFEDSISRPNLNSARKFSATNGVTSLHLSRVSLMIRSVGLENAAILYNTRFLVGAQDLPLQHFKLDRFLNSHLVLYRFDNIIKDIECTAIWETAINSISAAELVIEKKTVYEGSHPGANQYRHTRIENNLGKINCNLKRISTKEFVAELLPLDVPVLIKIKETYFPGWKAKTNNGQVLGTAPVDVSFLGVIAPPGTTSVSVYFEPNWFKPLLGLTILGVFLVLLGWFKDWKKQNPLIEDLESIRYERK